MIELTPEDTFYSISLKLKSEETTDEKTEKILQIIDYWIKETSEHGMFKRHRNSAFYFLVEILKLHINTKEEKKVIKKLYEALKEHKEKQRETDES